MASRSAEGTIFVVNPLRTAASRCIPARAPRSVGVAVAISLAIALCGLGCQNRKVKVEISAQGDEATRTFATNDTNAKSLEAVEQAYGTKASADAELGARFTGTFNEDLLPSEIGNRGAIGRLDSSLGTMRIYYEQFADRRAEWTAMRDRVEGGILWMQIFGRFIETRKLKDDAARAEFSKWWNGEAIPFVSDAYLMYSGMQAVVQAKRIGVMPRGSKDFGERTADEAFSLSVFQPAAILLAERGWLNADELAAVQSAGAKAMATELEGKWLRDKIVEPAISRMLVRFDPSRKDMKLKDLAPIGLEFLLWIKASREYRDLVLASPAISDEIKADVRAGKWDFELPPPFGFRLLERPKVTEAEVVLDTGAEPFFTNGVWDKDAKRVVFKGGFYESKHRYAPYNAPYYALWALPSQRQESVFGTVILEGDELAAYCAWENALPDERRTQWTAALESLAAKKDASPAYALISELEKQHPAPIPLAKWVCEKAGKELPDAFLSKEERERRAKTKAGAAPAEADAAPAEPSKG